jgi:hypothetical protein
VRENVCQNPFEVFMNSTNKAVSTLFTSAVHESVEDKQSQTRLKMKCVSSEKIQWKNQSCSLSITDYLRVHQGFLRREDLQIFCTVIPFSWEEYVEGNPLLNRTSIFSVISISKRSLQGLKSKTVCRMNKLLASLMFGKLHTAENNGKE